VSGIRSRKFYDPKDLGKNRTKIMCSLDRKHQRIMRFGKPERSDVSGELVKWVKRERSDSVPPSGLLMITFVLPKF
jgi:hypothetical protein